MSKHSNRLLIVALLSAFAAVTAGSAAAREERDGKDRSKQEQRAKSEQSTAGRHDGDRSGHDHDNDAVQMPPRTSVVTVTNSGASPLTITAPPTISRLSGNGSFAIVPPGTGTPCAASLVVTPRGGNCTIGVQYTPTDGERSTARLTLTDTGAATPTQETVIRSD